jgi:hypothetical protein
MRPLAITAILLTLLFVLLSACGSADEGIQNSPTTYSVSREYGHSMGGWDQAKVEATAKATQFCEQAGQQVVLRDERRSGSWFPGAPQKSAITFACVPDPSSTGEGGLKGNQQGDYNVGDKMILNAKRMAAIKKCTDGIKFNSDRYDVVWSGRAFNSPRSLRETHPPSTCMHRQSAMAPWTIAAGCVRLVEAIGANRLPPSGLILELSLIRDRAAGNEKHCNVTGVQCWKSQIRFAQAE